MKNSIVLYKHYYSVLIRNGEASPMYVRKSDISCTGFQVIVKVVNNKEGIIQNVNHCLCETEHQHKTHFQTGEKIEENILVALPDLKYGKITLDWVLAEAHFNPKVFFEIDKTFPLEDGSSMVLPSELTFIKKVPPEKRVLHKKEEEVNFRRHHEVYPVREKRSNFFTKTGRTII